MIDPSGIVLSNETTRSSVKVVPSVRNTSFLATARVAPPELNTLPPEPPTVMGDLLIDTGSPPSDPTVKGNPPVPPIVIGVSSVTSNSPVSGFIVGIVGTATFFLLLVLVAADIGVPPVAPTVTGCLSAVAGFPPVAPTLIGVPPTAPRVTGNLPTVTGVPPGPPTVNIVPPCPPTDSGEPLIVAGLPPVPPTVNLVPPLPPTVIVF